MPSNDAKRVDSRDDLLATISPKLVSPGAEPKPRIGIDIDLLAKAERNAENTEEDDIMKRLDAPVLVVFELPDGSEGEKTFKLGQTVEVLKAFVEDEFEIDSFIMLRRMALLAWIGSHADTDLARSQAPHFASGTARLAADYLERFAK